MHGLTEDQVLKAYLSASADEQHRMLAAVESIDAEESGTRNYSPDNGYLSLPRPLLVLGGAQVLSPAGDLAAEFLAYRSGTAAGIHAFLRRDGDVRPSGTIIMPPHTSDEDLIDRAETAARINLFFRENGSRGGKEPPERLGIKRIDESNMDTLAAWGSRFGPDIEFRTPRHLSPKDR